jgi:NAD(P)H-dependent FMN reductase
MLDRAITEVGNPGRSLMSKLQIIVGSTRPTRASDHVTPWVADRAEHHEAFEVELLDLRDWPLPIFQEHMGTLGDFVDPPYSEPIVKRWNNKIAEADAYLMITPEYNHSVPGVLKNALDSVFASFAFRNKPVAFVGYSNGIAAGTRAVEHLAQIAIELELHPLKYSALIPYVENAFNDLHDPIDPGTDVALEVVLDDLAWWASVLTHARSDGQLMPGIFRAREAVAARAAASLADDQ